MFIVEAVGLHEPRKTGVVRLMTFGAAVGVLAVSSPPLDRFMNPVDRIPALVLVRAVGQRHLLVTVGAKSGKLVVVFRNSRGTSEGISVEVMPRYRLSRLWVIGIPAAGNIFTPGSRFAVRTVRYVVAGRIGRGLIFLVRRGQPAPFQQRHGIRPPVTESSRYPVRVMTGGTKTINHGGVWYDLIGIPGRNFEGEGVNDCKRKKIVGCYLTKLPTVCSSGNQKIKVLPLVCSPVFRTVKKSGAGPAGRSAAVLGKVRQRTGRFGGLQVTADNGLHYIPFGVTCSGTLCSLAKSLGILVTHDRGSCAKRTVSPR